MKQKLYKVRAGSLDEAYEKLRRNFGEQAVVLGTQQTTEGGLLGLFGRKVVEITVSVPAPAPQQPAPRPQSAFERKYAAQSKLTREPQSRPSREELEKIIRAAQERMNRPAPDPQPSPAPRPLGAGGPERPVAERNRPSLEPPGPPAGPEPSAAPVLPFPSRQEEAPGKPEDLRREVREIREMIQVLYAEAPGAALPSDFAPHYRTLLERGVSRKVAAALIGNVIKHSDLKIIRDPRIFIERLHMEIRKLAVTTGGIALEGGRRKVVALCGATGVGKTTNIAKLAAQFSVRELGRVALVTADTYRIAAPEQLRVYANIIGLPVRVADDAAQMREALDAFRDFDLVLIDTAGGSQYNLQQINELKGILAEAHPDEVFLVMSAGTPLEDMRNVAANFKCLHPGALLFTKIDETRQYGAMLSILAESGLPLSYVSTGQNVPDDIRVATGGMLANLILEGRKNRG